MLITIHFVSANDTKEATFTTLDDGSFSYNFIAQTTGTWLVDASFNATATMYESQTPVVTLKVEETLLTRYLWYISGGIGAVAAVGIVLYFRKSRT
jgi:hypothetical protein